MAVSAETYEYLTRFAGVSLALAAASRAPEDSVSTARDALLASLAGDVLAATVIERAGDLVIIAADAGEADAVLAGCESIVSPFADDLLVASTALGLRAQARSRLLLCLDRVQRVLMACEATPRRDFIDRPDAATWRARLAALMANAAEDAPSEAQPALDAAMAAHGLAAEYITRKIADLAPLIRVSTGIALPSLALAWALYADPLRADELTARTRAPWPGALPTSFDALSA